MKQITYFLIGASVAIALEAASAAGAIAATLMPTDIQFGTDNINTWLYTDPANPTRETVNGVQRRVLNDFSNYGNTSKAIQALTDNDSSTNVELWTKGEVIDQNVGFSAKLGTDTIRLESVTLSDWSSNQGQLAKSWLDGFLNAYDAYIMPELKSLIPTYRNDMLTALQAKGLYSSGDPNIGGLSLETTTQQLKVDLVGHRDRASLYVDTAATITDTRKKVNGKVNPTYGQKIPNPNYLKPKNDPRYATGNAVLDSAIATIAAAMVQRGLSFQMSEIAKVTFRDQVDYAFAFSATDSDAIAGDRNKATDSTSHTGVYTWTKQYPIKQVPPKKQVPEPGMMLATLAIAGVGYRMRRRAVE